MQILRSFGNISKSADYEASGFSSSLRLNFNSNGKISSGEIKAELLERSVVTKNGSHDRNFKIFYQLLDSGDSKLLEKLMLKPKISEYKILQKNKGEKLTEGDINKTSEAFEALDFSRYNVEEILSTIAFVLHIGNINFEQGKDENFTSETIIRARVSLY